MGPRFFAVCAVVQGGFPSVVPHGGEDECVDGDGRVHRDALECTGGLVKSVRVARWGVQRELLGGLQDDGASSVVVVVVDQFAVVADGVGLRESGEVAPGVQIDVDQVELLHSGAETAVGSADPFGDGAYNPVVACE